MLMNVLTLGDVLTILENGEKPTVEVVRDFSKDMDNVRLEPSMKAVLVSYRFGLNNNVVLDLDVSEFEDYNLPFQTGPECQGEVKANGRQKTEPRFSISLERNLKRSSGLRLLKF